MTTEELEAIRARAEAATPGPWTHGGYPLKGIGGPEVLAAGDVHLLTMVCRPDDDTDATFIAHARQDVPALCDEVARLTSECHAMDEAITIACADRGAVAADLRAAREEVERLRAELAEAQATLANERGEGSPPVPGFAFIGNNGERSAWSRVDGPVGAYATREIDNMGRVRWSWAVIEDRYGSDESPRFRDIARGYAPTAREAMRAAANAVRGES